MSLDLDHTLVRAIHLLHSKSKESADVLKQMYEDAVAHKLGIKDYRPASIASSKQENIYPTRRPSPKCASSDIPSKSKKSDEITRKHELGKRSEKFSSDGDSSLLPSEPKRHKLDSPRVSPGQSPVPQQKQSTPSPTSLSNDENQSKSNNDGNTDADEFAFEMDLVCIVCRQMDVAMGNQLIECQECHSLYHQECHRPPVTDHDVNDPRLVWYCAKCKKNMKKIVTAPKPQKQVSKPAAAQTTKDNTFNKAFKSDTFSSLQHPFKRVETKSSTTTSGSNKPTGMAGLAANLSSKSSAVGSTTSTTKSSMKMSSTKSLTTTVPSNASNPIKGLASLALSLKPSKHSDKNDN